MPNEVEKLTIGDTTYELAGSGGGAADIPVYETMAEALAAIHAGDIDDGQAFIVTEGGQGQPIFVGTTAAINAADQAGQIPDGMIIYCTDDEATDGLTALMIDYDNSDSGLEANTVQGAIDEISGDLGEIYSTPYFETTITQVDWHGFLWLPSIAGYNSKVRMAYNVQAVSADATFALQLNGNSVRVFLIDATNNTIRLANPNDTLSIAIRVYYIPNR